MQDDNTPSPDFQPTFQPDTPADCPVVKPVYQTGRRVSASARCLDILHAVEIAVRERGAVKPLETFGAPEILELCLELIVPRIKRTDWAQLREDIRKGKRG